MIAVFPHARGEAMQYPRELNLPIDDVRQADLGKVGVHATPALLLVDDTGLLEKIRIGKLPGEQETEGVANM